jgi:hypothetical protein
MLVGGSVGAFYELAEIKLRRYQLEPAQAIIDAVQSRHGGELAVVMSRQAGKNELSAAVECYLLHTYSRVQRVMVKAVPTFQPQAVTSMRRLRTRLEAHPLTSGRWRSEAGYIVALERAEIHFMSAARHSNVVGATASLLLECDEAQDVQPDKWYKDFVPMAASTNALRVYYGTVWTSDTLLAKTVARLQRLEVEDGRRRVFWYPWHVVAEEVPIYGQFVEAEIERLGRDHPLIRTQYLLEPIDDRTRLFPRARMALMRGDHPRGEAPLAGRIYAAALDVAGAEETGLDGPLEERAAAMGARRDATALTVFEVDLSRLAEQRVPTYLVVDRYWWLDVAHTQVFERLVELVQRWRLKRLIVDATGVGAGLASFLTRRLGAARVRSFVFGAAAKSKLGWSFLAVVETGRFKDHAPDGSREQRQFWYEVEACRYEVSHTPARLMRWGVWEAARYDAARDVALGRDDLLVSAALCAELDQGAWSAGGSFVLPGDDVLGRMDRGAF